MELLIVVTMTFVVAALLFAVIKRPSTRVEEGKWPFFAKRPLTVPEQVLYFRLSKALPEHIILAQVGLSRLLGVKKGNNFQAWYNRINRMSADFVICTKDSTIVAVIELDDSTHERDDRRAADAKKDKALSDAGIRIIRWQAKSLPDEAVIRGEFVPIRAFEGETAAEPHLSGVGPAVKGDTRH